MGQDIIKNIYIYIYFMSHAQSNTLRCAVKSIFKDFYKIRNIMYCVIAVYKEKNCLGMPPVLTLLCFSIFSPSAKTEMSWTLWWSLSQHCLEDSRWWHSLDFYALTIYSSAIVDIINTSPTLCLYTLGFIKPNVFLNKIMCFQDIRVCKLVKQPNKKRHFMIHFSSHDLFSFWNMVLLTKKICTYFK